MRFVTRLLMFAAAVLLPTVLGLRAEGAAFAPATSPPCMVLHDGRADLPAVVLAVVVRDAEYLTLDVALPDGLPRCRHCAGAGRSPSNSANLPAATGRAAPRQPLPA